GNISSITAKAGRLAFDTVSAQGGIGAITAHSNSLTFTHDIFGNAYPDSLVALDSSSHTDGIEESTFTAITGNIGAVTATSGARGDAIFDSAFTAKAGSIAAITATSGSNFHDDAIG